MYLLWIVLYVAVVILGCWFFALIRIGLRKPKGKKKKPGGEA